MVNLYTAHLSELPILLEKGKYRFLNEIIFDDQYMQVAWLKGSNRNECIALYGMAPIKVLDKNADRNLIIGV